MNNEAGGKHYGDGCTPWHLQRDMKTWGSVFIDARRTDVIEYLFRTKGDRQLDDARKALHNCEVIIAELEKALLPAIHESHVMLSDDSCGNCRKYNPKLLKLPCVAIDRLNEIAASLPDYKIHPSHKNINTVQSDGKRHCGDCGKWEENLATPCDGHFSIEYK